VRADGGRRRRHSTVDKGSAKLDRQQVQDRLDALKTERSIQERPRLFSPLSIALRTCSGTWGWLSDSMVNRCIARADLDSEMTVGAAGRRTVRGRLRGGCRHAARDGARRERVEQAVAGQGL
jgi:hypothetical protein